MNDVISSLKVNGLENQLLGFLFSSSGKTSISQRVPLNATHIFATISLTTLAVLGKTLLYPRYQTTRNYSVYGAQL